MQTFMLLSNPLQREFSIFLISPCGAHSVSKHYAHLQISKNNDVVRQSLLFFYWLVRLR